MTASPHLRKTFDAFRDQCIWLRNCFNTFVDLYHDDRRQELLKDAAFHFFNELHQVLHLNIIVTVCRLTDPANVCGKECLTVDNLNEQLKAEQLFTESMAQSSAGLLRYRELVLPARHKLGAHLDKTVHLKPKLLGQHSAEDVQAFFADLQSYNDEVGRAVGAGPLDFQSSRGEGDASTLCKVLRAGVDSLESKRNAQRSPQSRGGP